MPVYAGLSTDSAHVIEDVITYGRIVCVFSIGLFLESVWTKVLQANGDMKTPMIAQILGALTNIVLDPLLIFGMFGLPQMGIALSLIHISVCDGVCETLSSGVCHVCRKGSEHSIVNTGKDDLVLLTVVVER